MAFYGSACPEDQNSTDCLLRTLLQLLDDQRNADDAETNWDPITFYVTLAIGILAAMFTVVTIVQAAVAAGKGRRKTNHVAIGDWAAKSTRKRSLHELNRQYTAHTPLILIDTLVEALTKEDSKPQSAAPAEETESQLSDNIPPRYQPSSTATWVRFLGDFGLSRVVSPSKWTELESVLADNLPDGVVAPAYAQVGVIVGTTLALGAHMQIQETGAGLKYPQIVGDGFQFEFVSYPILGMVGTYYRHGHAALPSIRSKNELGMAITNMNYGRGVLELATTAPFDQLQPQAIDLLKNSDRLRIRELLVQAEQHSTAVNRPVPRLRTIADDYLPLASLFWAATPKFVPSLFPKTTLCMNFPFTAVALNGGFWSRLNLKDFSQTEITTWPKSVETPIWKRFEWTGFHATLGHGVHIDESGDNSFRLERRLQQLRTTLQDNPERFKRAEAFTRDVEAETKAHFADIEATEAAYLSKIEAAKGEEWKLRNQYDRAEAQARWVKDKNAKAKEEYESIQKGLTSIRLALYGHQIAQGDPDTNLSPIGEWWSLVADVEAGHCVVLHMCIKLLYDPNKLLRWFSSISPLDQKLIRSTILGQMNAADAWLLYEEEGLVNRRRALLCNTTMALIQAEKATGNPNLGLHIGSNLAPDGGPSNESDKVKSTDDCVADDYVVSRHLNTLIYLRGAYEFYGVDGETRKAIQTLEGFRHRLARKAEILPDEIEALKQRQLDSIELLESRSLRIYRQIPYLLGSTIFEDDDYANLHRLLERFREITNRLLPGIGGEPLLQDDEILSTDVDLALRNLRDLVGRQIDQDLRMQRETTLNMDMRDLLGEMEQDTDTDIDDVIIYRCLLMALLFFTNSPRQQRYLGVRGVESSSSYYLGSS
ncbi:hypothetical protein CMUS01_07619 [Colletotrichum musicola]|uniref:Uncharacterized protein n=1 Tax=Colletotrichum musicola TaxID=2175873 RepID=A0A8H6KGS0_9PEZI|nr:hypothetical protein CMUS01_07619 [Colletotrichum musicola]